MKSSLGIVGILLILFGVVALAYQGITYTKREQVAQIGDVSVTADTQKTVYLSPVFGGVSLAVGILLVIISRRDMK